PPIHAHSSSSDHLVIPHEGIERVILVTVPALEYMPPVIPQEGIESINIHMNYTLETSTVVIPQEGIGGYHSSLQILR
ncbi:MAG: hypothetical protein QXG21_06370, partial [Candidatus Caldarchaeum sp.]